MPRIIEAAMGKCALIEMYGVDYATTDGTCVRDYIHVSDLAEAHVLALQHLLSGNESFAVNLGSGRGATVREVIAAVEGVVGAKVNVKPAPRRPGDPPVLVADPSRAVSLLHWHPKFSSLEKIVITACRWHRRTFPSAGSGSDL
jgi:UDP-glucose 4-epimerase